MTAEPGANLIVFYAALPVVIDPRYPGAQRLLGTSSEIIDYYALDSCLKPFEGDYFKLGEGAFIIDEDRCYAALLQLIQHCQKSKYRFAIFPVGEAAVSLSPVYEELKRWLTERKKRCRFTGVLLPDEMKRSV